MTPGQIKRMLVVCESYAGLPDDDQFSDLCDVCAEEPAISYCAGCEHSMCEGCWHDPALHTADCGGMHEHGFLEDGQWVSPEAEAKAREMWEF